ncbi:MAG: hypothetical protein QOG79_3050 [Mycobacterium sp.]|nr:hypothetical protein [Mycobacterium sp.]
MRALVMPVWMYALISGHQISMVAARVSSSGIWQSMHQVRIGAGDGG